MLKHDTNCLETASEEDGTPALLLNCDESNTNQVINDLINNSFLKVHFTSVYFKTKSSIEQFILACSRIRERCECVGERNKN